MKIVIGVPPLPNTEGFPQVTQNRQFQFFHEPTFIYPVVMAYAATMLKQKGHEVIWLDGPAEGLDWEDYRDLLILYEPDMIVWEVKTPTVKRVWPLVDAIKNSINTIVVLMGDHITALPNESRGNCKVDYCLTGGDYDFSLVKLAGNLPPKGIVDYGTKHSLEILPVIDRELTRWRNYAYKNGNFKYLPGAYTYFGRDCWWRQAGGCTFCSWTSTFPNFRVMSVDQAMAEVEHCASLGIREIFDDTGTFPAGAWLYDFCERMIKFNHGTRRITMGCNMRPGALKEADWKIMGAAGFRFILFGLESANTDTLDRINKGQRYGDIESSCRMATRYGMHPHATCMVGYPWETKEDAERTINFTRRLFRQGLLHTLQATIVIPYPGTKLFQNCLDSHQIRTLDWNEYDMSRPIMTCPITDAEINELTRDIYKSCITFPFIVKKLFSIRSADDVFFLARAAKYLMGHLKDFK